METAQRGKKKVNKRSNVEKFNENIGNIKNMKDKMKSEKQSPIPGVEVKSEPNLDVEFKKEPGLCENESKNSNICAKGGDNKNMKPGMLETGSMVKVQDRPYMEPKSEIISRPEDNSEEEELQSGLLSSKVKTEGGGPDGPMYPPDSNENLMMGLCNQPGPAPNSGGNLDQPGPGIQAGVQPLPSNVINKQPGTMEAQYMQQQSQIFVFTTALANKSAEAVLQGQYPSIIAYHCAQPGTKKYLEKHPLKLNQFNRQSPAQWLNNLAQIKQKTVFGGGSNLKAMNPMPMGPRGLSGGGLPGQCEMGGSGPGPGPGPGMGNEPRPMAPNMQGGMTELDGMTEGNDSTAPNRDIPDHRPGDFPPGGVNPINPMNLWNQGNMNQNNLGYSGPMKNMDREKQCALNRPPLLDNMNPNHFPGVSQLTLTGTKVPTENLTPQQRQHRAEQLATLRKMHEMLFPENQQAQPTDEFGNPRMIQGGNINVPPNSDDPNRNNVIDSGDMKNPIGLKNVNNNNNNNNNSNNNNSNNNNNNNSNNNNTNTTATTSTTSTTTTTSTSTTTTTTTNNNNNNAMNRSIGRNINGQTNRNQCPMEGPLNHNMVNPNSNVLDTPENMDSSAQDQNSQMMQKMQGSNNFPSMAAQLEWQKHYQQFQEEQKKKKGSRTDSPAPRNCNKMQGPPPPYHQTARSASVPIAVPSPNPGSPNNTTSNLSLPSPRTSSDLNSPSDMNKHSAPGGNLKMSTCSPPNNQGSPSCSKLIVSNPETPVSASQSPTPSSRKETSQSGLEYPNKDVFSRAVTSLSQQKHHKPPTAPSNKEPNLMPVPSPQQIQYLNTFEGQELTIQKQPNTSLKETNINSPMSHTPLSETPKCKTPNGAANSPLPQVAETSPRFPNVVTSSATCTTPVSTQSQTTVPASKDTTTVPSSPDASGPSPCRSENLPLNPNGINCPPNNKSMHFDPITSLAQMSQQLTSQTTPPCPGSGPIMSYNTSSMHMVGNMGHMDPHVGGPLGHENQGMENLPFPPNNPVISCSGPMMDMSPGFLTTSSPKPNMGTPPARCVGPFFGGPGFQRMMAPNTYNGMNVQVKANTPNTIQYLPARPNTNSPNSRGPPSLDFLQRFTNPMNNMDSKVSFIPNCHSNSMEGVSPGGNAGMNCGPMGNSGGPIMSNPVPNMLLGGNMVLNPGSVGPLRGQLRPGGLMKVPPMGGGNAGFPPPGPGCDPMNPMGPGGNAAMFIQGSKSSPLGMPPDASQPLPPSMSQGNNFKNSPFVGPSMADPNYAQQFHNFQQQLYATNTRSHQINSHLNQSYFLPK